MSVKTINPATEEDLAEYEFDQDASLEATLSESHEAYSHWRKLNLEARLNCVEDFAQALHGARHELAEKMTREMGKTLKDSLAEVDKTVVSCKILVRNFPVWLSERNYRIPEAYQITHQPLGVLLGIMPWNFPLWQVARFAVPALLCGNTILIKHSRNTWGSAEFIAELFKQAFPHRVYSNLKIDVSVIEKVLKDRRVSGASLTGSRQAGSKVGAIAGANLKKCVLELGGSDAYVILDDADLDLAAQLCVTSRLLNGGQSCVAAKRFIVTHKNASAFTESVLHLMRKKKFGNPFDSTSDFGPMARKDLRVDIHQDVLKSIASGAKLALGGQIPSGKGFFYPATLLTNVRPGQPAFDEELFGPVAAIIETENETQALGFANRSRYGLGAAIFSRDVERAQCLAREEIDAGMIAINDYVKSDAIAPFGGIKDSGLGRELGKDGCFEFTNVKSVFHRIVHNG